MTSERDRSGKSNSSISEALEETEEELKAQKKKKLQKEIRELKDLNFQMKCTLGIRKFGQYKITNEFPESINISKTMIQGILNVELKYKNDLYFYSGFRCVKFTENEYIFHMLSSSHDQKKNIFAIQILNNNDKIKVGKWLMPESVNKKQVLSETPLNVPNDITVFLRNCKHHIDCYNSRKEQFDKLKTFLDAKKKCILGSNLGYTRITLQFFKVHDVNSNVYLNIIVYLVYHSEHARPYKIYIDSMNDTRLTDVTIEQWKLYMKQFQLLDLEPAFKESISALNSSDVWTLQEDEDGPFEFNDASSESESFLKPFQTKKLAKKRRRKRKQKNTDLHSSENESMEDENLLERTKTRKSKTGARKAAVPSNKSKSKLRQSTLNFEITKSKKATCDDTDSDVSLAKRLLNNKADVTKAKTKNKVFTSTPFRKNKKTAMEFISSNISEVSSIEPIVSTSKSKL